MHGIYVWSLFTLIAQALVLSADVSLTHASASYSNTISNIPENYMANKTETASALK